MKTVMYKDHDGNIVVEDYLEYLDSYDRGLVPRQKIDVSGVPVDSDELYKIIDEADVNATIRTAMEEKANGSRDHLKGKCKNPKHLFLYTVPALLWMAWHTESLDDLEMRHEGVICISLLFLLIVGFIGIYRGGYELDDIIENYREKRWKRFPRK